VYVPTPGGNYLASSDNNTTGGTVDANECFTVVSGVPTPNPIPTTPVTAPILATATSTQVSVATVTVGHPFSDTATVSNSTSAPDGSVVFSICGPTAAASTCTPTASNTVGAGAETLAADSGNASVATSNTVTPTAAGFYCFAAVYTPTSGSDYAGSTDNVIGSANSAECVDVTTTPAPAAPQLTVVKSSSPVSGSAVARGTEVTYSLTLTNAGLGLASGVTVVDSVPSGTTYVSGSASCGDVPTCAVVERNGVVTWSGVDVAADSGTAPGTATLTFDVVVGTSDPSGEVISNVASFTNEHTPSCTATTCATNTVTLTVVVPVVSSASGTASSPPAVVKAATSTPLAPVPGATTVHTGKPWAGSRPYEVAAFAFGLLLVGFGTRRRRVARRAAQRQL